MATEDIGNADPRALTMTLEACAVYERLGSPEGELAIAQAIVFMACAAKSNAVYTAYNAAMQDVEKLGSLPVPLHLRNAPTKLMKEIGYGKDYQYAHNIEDKVADMQCLPDNLRDRTYYHPTAEGVEKRIQERLAQIKSIKTRKHRDAKTTDEE